MNHRTLNTTKHVYISVSNGRYNFHSHGQVLHSLHMDSTPYKRLLAHWEQFAKVHMGKPTESARVAVQAAKMRHRVGRYSSTLYATNRGVSARMLCIAVQNEAMNQAKRVGS